MPTRDGGTNLPSERVIVTISGLMSYDEGMRRASGVATREGDSPLTNQGISWARHGGISWGRNSGLPPQRMSELGSWKSGKLAPWTAIPEDRWGMEGVGKEWRSGPEAKIEQSILEPHVSFARVLVFHFVILRAMSGWLCACPR
jgi:hypothetical protein